MVIVGGGIAGLTMSLCLAQRGVESVVLEKGQFSDETGAGIQLTPNATKVLFSLGLAHVLQQRAIEPQYLLIRSWNSGSVVLRWALGQRIRTKLHAPYLVLSRSELIEILVDSIRTRPEITLQPSEPVLDFDVGAHGPRARTHKGHYTGQCIVAADGVQSTIGRTQAKPSTRFIGAVAWRTSVPVDLLPSGLRMPRVNIWWGRDSHFVHYPVKGGSEVNCVGVVQRSVDDAQPWHQIGDKQQFREDFAGWHRDVQLLIDQAPSDGCFVWTLAQRRPLRNWWYDGNVVLIGDACHPVLPFLAQGAALAIEDAQVLATLLSRCEGYSLVDHRFSQLQDAFVAFQKLRYRRVRSIQRRSMQNARIFHTSGLLAKMRNLITPTVVPLMLESIYSYDATSVR